MEIAQILATHDIKDEGDIKLDSRLLYQYMKERRNSWKQANFTYIKFHGTVRDFFAPWENPDIEERFDESVTDKRTTNAYFIVGHDESMAFLSHHYADVIEAWAMEVKRIRKELRAARAELVTKDAVIALLTERHALSSMTGALVLGIKCDDLNLPMSRATVEENIKSHGYYAWVRGTEFNQKYKARRMKNEPYADFYTRVQRELDMEFISPVAPQGTTPLSEAKYQPLKLRPANQAP